MPDPGAARSFWLEEALRDSSIRLKKLYDPWGNHYYATFKSEWRFGDRVNLESDMLARYVEQVVRRQLRVSRRPRPRRTRA